MYQSSSSSVPTPPVFESSRPVLVTESRGAEDGGVNTVHPVSVSSCVMANVCHFLRDNKELKEDANRKDVRDVSGERSPLVLTLKA